MNGGNVLNSNFPVQFLQSCIFESSLIHFLIIQIKIVYTVFMWAR